MLYVFIYDAFVAHGKNGNGVILAMFTAMDQSPKAATQTMPLSNTELPDEFTV